jgi:CheY-like chemotaxis protein/anti-sigma regulatory factor (Ser/Thr protein kinase)
MSHEIRTPLNGVLGMAQAMASGDLPTEQRERLEVIQQSGQSLLAILNDILDLAKIESGKLEFETIEFDLATVVNGAHRAFAALASEKGLGFELAVDAGAEGVYLGDPTRVRQVLYNLLSNALKFTDKGHVAVRARREGDQLSVQVIDTGLGMTAEQMDQLFAKFTQADTSTTRRFGGTGLGLAISRELAERMGGTLDVASTPGRGSTFTLNLPLERVGEARAAVPAAQTEAHSAEAMTIRLLAAEDNTINQLVLRTLLAQLEIEPDIVENGALALAAWESGAYDVILMDVQMPEMDGPAATRAIRAREAETGRPRTPIIALTANAMAHQVTEYAEAGMDGHVAKPIDARLLFEALQSALDGKDEAADVRRSA